MDSKSIWTLERTLFATAEAIEDLLETMHEKTQEIRNLRRERAIWLEIESLRAKSGKIWKGLPPDSDLNSA